MEKELPSKTQRFWYRLLRFGFRLLYNELAWTYDIVSWIVSLGRWRSWQETGLLFITGNSVLELAHGPGHMLLEMESTGYEIVGIDLSERMGRLALARLKRSGKKIPMIRGRAESLPFASSHFDTILTTFPAEFIVARKTIASSYEVLKPGGRMVIVLEAHFTGGGPLHRSIEFLYAITGQRQSPGQSSGSSPYWTAITNRFTDQGYQLLHERVKLRDSQVIVIIAEKPPQTAMD